MPRFAANLTMLFTEVDFLDRFQAAAEAGFDAVEYLFPYAYDAAQLADRLDAHGLRQVLFNLPAGDWAAGDRGIACQPDRVGEFQDGVGRALDYAAALGVQQVNCLAGIADGIDPAVARETLIANLRFAADALGGQGLRLNLEAVNTRDIPGFFVHTTDQALAILDEVGSTAGRYQFDLYHMQVMEGDLTTTLRERFERIGHIQVADNPGRHEPGTGEIAWPFLFDAIDALGYEGWIGCEYKPATTTTAGLGWVTPYLAGSRRTPS